MVKRPPCNCGGIIGAKNERNYFNQDKICYYCTKCRKKINLRENKRDFMLNNSIEKILVYFSTDFDRVINIAQLKSYLKHKGLKDCGSKEELIIKVKNCITNSDGGDAGVNGVNGIGMQMIIKKEEKFLSKKTTRKAASEKPFSIFLIEKVKK